MRAKRAITIAAILVIAGYAAYPFATLYQLQFAARHGDAPTLSRMIDWSSVREGIKEDICDLVLEEPSDPAKKGELPAFGASFVRGVTGTSVDRQFTAEALASAAQPASTGKDDASITWAFFTGPTRFSVHVTLIGETEPIRAELALTGLWWRVVRVRIPSSLLVESHLRA